MSAANLVVHAGGWNATEEEVNAVPVPEHTKTYTPIPHGRLIEQLQSILPRQGMKLERLQLALSNKGERLFGVADVVNGTGQPDWGIAIGFRNSYDRSFALNMCAGSRVFVCDNLAFHGEVTMRHRHVGMLDAELPSLVSDLVHGVAVFKGEVAAQVDALKGAELDDRGAHDLVCRSIRAGVFPARAIPLVLDEWHEPKHEEFRPRTAWSLFNAFTEAAKVRTPELQMRSTLSLNAMFNQEFARN